MNRSKTKENRNLISLRSLLFSPPFSFVFVSSRARRWKNPLAFGNLEFASLVVGRYRKQQLAPSFLAR